MNYEEIKDFFSKAEQTIKKFDRLTVDLERANKCIAETKRMIETLANRLVDLGDDGELVKNARIYLSILEGYGPPYTPSRTYPNVKDFHQMEPYASWREKVDKQSKSWLEKSSAKVARKKSAPAKKKKKK